MATEERGTSRGVVVGTDGSSAAERAVDWAADEAVRRGTDLHVLYAFPSESQARAWEFTPSPELHKTGERVVAASVERIGRPGLPVTSEVLVEDPATALVAGSVGADLVVVGAR